MIKYALTKIPSLYSMTKKKIYQTRSDILVYFFKTWLLIVKKI